MNTTITTRRGTAIEVINCGNFLLDGGTMFGRVPKVMWEKWFPTDGKNRITMATNVLRIVKDGRTYVVETGLGSLYTANDWEIMGTSLDRVRLLTDPVDCLICTHLHWDHCGGIQDMEVRSEVIVSRMEWEDARGENPSARAATGRPTSRRWKRSCAWPTRPRTWPTASGSSPHRAIQGAT